MTEVTDKMLDAARRVLLEMFSAPDGLVDSIVRDMLGAALASREPANAGVLVEALKIIASIDDKVYWEDWEKVEEAVLIAKSAIAKVGVKL